MSSEPIKVDVVLEPARMKAALQDLLRLLAATGDDVTEDVYRGELSRVVTPLLVAAEQGRETLATALVNELHTFALAADILLDSLHQHGKVDEVVLKERDRATLVHDIETLIERRLDGRGDDA